MFYLQLAEKDLSKERWVQAKYTRKVSSYSI